MLIDDCQSDNSQDHQSKNFNNQPKMFQEIDERLTRKIYVLTKWDFKALTLKVILIKDICTP